MPFIPTPSNLKTSTAMADDLGIPRPLFFRLTNETGEIPRPATEFGRRLYYGPAEAEAVRQAVEQLRAKGRLQMSSVTPGRM